MALVKSWMQSVYGIPATVERWQINRCKVSYCTYLEVARLVYRIIRCARPRIELLGAPHVGVTSLDWSSRTGTSGNKLRSWRNSCREIELMPSDRTAMNIMHRPWMPRKQLGTLVLRRIIRKRKTICRKRNMHSPHTEIEPPRLMCLPSVISPSSVLAIHQTTSAKRTLPFQRTLRVLEISKPVS